ncbi:MAG: right-handed parallel beta-helix repeat-containing protein [Acidobacteria bacterium]|nr:right-handed parallel beta-helix repeat-containing protein [Acidobacteriota bacterium]
MRQHVKWLVLAITTVVVGCVGDSAPGTDAGGVGDAAHFALTAGTPTVAMLTPGREAVVELRGSVAQPLVRLNVGPRAITRPVELSIRETAAPWGHVGPAYEIEPSGLEFAEPVTIEFDLNTIDLPPGVAPGALRVGTVESGRWVPVESRAADVGGATTVAAEPPRVVSAQLRHLSPYGLVADPREVSGVGRRLEANGIVAETTDEVYARLFVSPTIVTLYVDGGAAGTTQLTLSGLPTDEDHVLYVDDHDGMRTIGPADGGSVTVDLDRTEPHLLWLQQQPSTVQIGGPYDACATIGSWTDPTTCTLSTDVADNVVIAQSGVTLDCDGHSITPPLKPPPSLGEVLADQGAGILISKIHDVGVRECHVGRPGAGFGIGIWVYYTDGADIADNVLTENVQGIVSQVSTGVVVHDNQVQDSWVSGVAIQDLASVTAENLPPPLPQVEVWGNTISQTADSKSTAIDVRGTPASFINEAVGVATNGLPPITVHDNVVSGGGNAITLANVLDADVQQNDFDGPERGLLILDGGWPSRFWQNNVTASMFGVVDLRQPASGGTLPPANYTYKEPPPDGAPPDVPLVEVSWSDQGSWWGHSCAEGALFTPGVDSNAVHVRDSHAYGTRSAWVGGGVPGCVGDVDGDTVPDGADNCPTVPNPGQEDGEGDGVGDACDLTPPEAPVVLSPEMLSTVISSTVAVEGLAEPRAAVELSLDDTLILTTLASPTGRFEATFVLVPDGIHGLAAVARDAAGNRSEPSPSIAFAVHTRPPNPPWIVDPAPLAFIASSSLDVGGTAAPNSSVSLSVDGVADRRVAVDDQGAWLVLNVGPLDAGVHDLVAVAEDPWGLVSEPSQAVRVAVQPVDEERSVLGERSYLEVVEIGDTPDPLLPARESTALTASVRAGAKRPLPRRSVRNQLYLSRARWSVFDPAGTRTVATVQTWAPLERDPSNSSLVAGSLRGRWNGEADDGTPLPAGRQLAYKLSVDLAWTLSRGDGALVCGRSERAAVDDLGRHVCVIDSVEVPIAGTIGILALPPFPGSVLRAEPGWAVREVVALRFEASDRYAVVASLAGVSWDPRGTGPHADRLVYWILDGNSGHAAYGEVLPPGAPIEIYWNEAGDPSEPERHAIRGLAVTAVVDGDTSCGVVSWIYDLNPAQDIGGGGTGAEIIERVGLARICDDGVVSWVQAPVGTSTGERYPGIIAPAPIEGVSVAAHATDVLLVSGDGSTFKFNLRRMVDGGGVAANECWVDTLLCPAWAAGAHPTPARPAVVWHGASGRYQAAVVIKVSPRDAVYPAFSCIIKTHVASDGTPADTRCLEGGPDDGYVEEGLPADLRPRRLRLASAWNSRNPSNAVLVSTEHAIYWLDEDGRLVASTANPQRDEGLRALCADWKDPMGSTIGRGFRWDYEWLDPYPSDCSSLGRWKMCLALSDPVSVPVRTAELIYEGSPAVADSGSSLEGFLADSCASADTFGDAEMLLVGRWRDRIDAILVPY